jgi:hypothetical protein
MALYGELYYMRMTMPRLIQDVGYYFRFVGLANLLLLTITIACLSVFNTIQYYWLQLWTESGMSNPVFYMVGFMMISFTAWFSTSCIMWSVSITRKP